MAALFILEEYPISAFHFPKIMIYDKYHILWRIGVPLSKIEMEHTLPS